MPSIKDIVAGQSIGVGQRVIKAGAERLRGIINDRTDESPTYGQFKVKKLTYPLDVVDDARQGHYIIFTVRTISKPGVVDDSGAKDKETTVNVTSELAQEDRTFGQNILSKLMGGGGLDNIKEVQTKLTKVANQSIQGVDESEIPKTDAEILAAKDDAGGHVGDSGERQGKRRFSLRPPTYRTDTMITLYMPPQVKNITGVTYKDQEMGLATVLVGSIIAAIGDDRKLEDIDKSGMGVNKALALIGSQLGFASKELMVLGTGQLFTPRMEFIFDAVKKRAFTYQFSFYPKSEQEAQEVREIIQAFRKNMLPSKIEGAKQDFLALNVPNEFNIEYYYKGNQNNFINQIGTCLLTDCDITIGGDRYGTFASGQTKDGKPGASPTEYHMTLTFQEMDIITQEDVDEGF